MGAFDSHPLGPRLAHECPLPAGMAPPPTVELRDRAHLCVDLERAGAAASSAAALGGAGPAARRTPGAWIGTALLRLDMTIRPRAGTGTTLLPARIGTIHPCAWIGTAPPDASFWGELDLSLKVWPRQAPSPLTVILMKQVDCNGSAVVIFKSKESYTAKESHRRGRP